MKIQTLRITNAFSDSINFSPPFFLGEDVNFTGLPAEVHALEVASDGARYQSTKLRVRQLDIPFYIRNVNTDSASMAFYRDQLFTVLNPARNPMRIDFETVGGGTFYVTAQLTSAPLLPSGFQNTNRGFSRGLLQFSAADPYIYSADQTMVTLAGWQDLFQFPLEIDIEKQVGMGDRIHNTAVSVVNGGHVDAGMVMTFASSGSVQNPQVLNAVTYELLKLSFQMVAGDIITVSTYQGRRSALLYRGNEWSNIFHAVTLDSVFLRLAVGENILIANAEENVDALSMLISYGIVQLSISFRAVKG